MTNTKIGDKISVQTERGFYEGEVAEIGEFSLVFIVKEENYSFDDCDDDCDDYDHDHEEFIFKEYFFSFKTKKVVERGKRNYLSISEWEKNQTVFNFDIIAHEEMHFLGKRMHQKIQAKDLHRVLSTLKDEDFPSGGFYVTRSDGEKWGFPTVKKAIENTTFNNDIIRVASVKITAR